MMSVSVDLSALKDLGVGLDGKLQAMAEEIKQQLAVQTYGRIVELSQERLHTRRSMFLENLRIDEGKNDEEATITLEGKAVWIDEGLKQDYLLEALLSGPKAKTSKPNKHGEVSTYAVVPFNSGPNQAQADLTSYNKDLVEAAKQAMKKQKLPWGKIVKDDQGRPILNKKIVDVKNIKTPNRWFGPGQGQGPLGAPRQGHTGIPFLEGAAVYQREVEDKEGNKRVKKYVLTFRTASSKHPEKWHHPGLEATNILDAGVEWAMEKLEKEIIPKLFDKHISR